MPRQKSNFLDKVLGRINRLDSQGVQTVVQRLARERDFLETLFDTIEDGVLVVDEEGRILYFNEAVTRLLGLQAPGAEGQLITKHLPDLDWSQLRQMDKNGGRKISRHEFEIAYPQPRFLSLYAAPLDGEAIGGAGMALILHDATEAREKTFATIESERLQALTLLAASVAHELGNPLNALNIHLQLMERAVRKLSETERTPGRVRMPGRKGASSPEPSAEDRNEWVGKLSQYIEVAKGEIARLDYIITQFLQAIRPVPPRMQRVSLDQVARETIALLRPEIENRGLILVEKLSARLPLVPLDPHQIKQALVNLIKNAIQSMARGGTLTLETRAASDGVWVGVADTGGGIPQDQINRIFEPFYTTKKRGTGLGLMIVQRIVREHGGRIELESRVGRGTTFRIWLPSQERPQRLLQSGEGRNE